MIRPLSDVLSKLGLIDVILAVVLCPNWGFRPRWRPGRYGNFDIVLDQFHENLNPPHTHTHTHTHTHMRVHTHAVWRALLSHTSIDTMLIEC